MKYGRAYEIVDGRRGVQKLHPCGMIRPVPGGVLIMGLDRRGLIVELPDDEDESLPYAEDPDRGTIEVMTPEGRITLVELRDSNFDDTVAPFIQDELPEFRSADERARYLYRLIEES